MKKVTLLTIIESDSAKRKIEDWKGELGLYQKSHQTWKVYSNELNEQGSNTWILEHEKARQRTIDDYSNEIGEPN